MNNEKHCSVIDAEGKHVTYVLVKIRDKPLEDGGTEQVEEVQNYTLKVGEQLVNAQPPVMRTHAGSTGFISPAWDGSQWAETATADEITAWEQEHPAPEVKPAPKSNAELEAENATLRQQVSALADQQSFTRTALPKWRKSSMRKLLAEITLKIYILLSEGELEMMAMLFSQRVILEKCTFEQVPKKLKKQVAEILVEECGMPELVPAEYGGTKDVAAA